MPAAVGEGTNRIVWGGLLLSPFVFYNPQVNAWGDQPTLEMVRLIVEWGGFCFLDKDKRGDFKVQTIQREAEIVIDRKGREREFKAAGACSQCGHDY